MLFAIDDVTSRFQRTRIVDRTLFDEKLYPMLAAPVLYNHCFEYYLSYYQQGANVAYHVEDGEEFLAVARKNKLKPQYFLHTPTCSADYLQYVVGQLTHAAEKDLIIESLSSEHADMIKSSLDQAFVVEKKKAAVDAIVDVARSAALTGRKYHSLRNAISRLKRDYPDIAVMNLSEENRLDALYALNNWKKTQGAKYFRLTMGRDISLINQFAGEIDDDNLFGIIVYVNGIPSSVSVACRSRAYPQYGMELTTKADVQFRGLSDFTSHCMFNKMHDAGITYSNEAGYYSPGIKLNKHKWRPVEEVAMYQLEVRRIR